MLKFVKSDLFLRFLGGFVLGAVGVLAMQYEQPPVLSGSAIAATTTADHAAR